MKKNIFAVALLAGLVLSVASTTAFAGTEETSRVEVELEQDNGHDKGSGPYKDKLSIVYKPTVFKFSGNTSDGSLILSNNNPQKDAQWLVVNDDRKDADGNLESSPWTVTGQLSALADSTDATKTLAGNMVFTPSALSTYDIGPLSTVNGVEDFEPAPVATGIGSAAGSDYALGGDKITLAAGGSEVTVMSHTGSTVSTPTGVVTNLGNVNLNIATGNATNAGSYKGTITWTLAAQL